jgi:hypothetical protein
MGGQLPNVCGAATFIQRIALVMPLSGTHGAKQQTMVPSGTHGAKQQTIAPSGSRRAINPNYIMTRAAVGAKVILRANYIFGRRQFGDTKCWVLWHGLSIANRASAALQKIKNNCTAHYARRS